MENSKKGNYYGQIIKYTGLFGGVQSLNILVGLVRNKLVAMLLGPLGMGLASLFSSSVKLVSDTTGFGLGMSAVREISEAYNRGKAPEVARYAMIIRSWSLVAALLGTVVFAMLSPVLDGISYSWGKHTLHFLLLSPMVGMMAVSTGEMAILKGTRMMKALAVSSFVSVLAALVISVPLYWFFGIKAVVPSLVLVCLAQTVAVMAPSCRRYPYRVSLGWSMLSQGTGIVRLGVAFVFAGFVGSGAEFAVRSYINYVDSETAVGLYNAVYVLVVSYAGMVFNALEADYFPRLSAVCLSGGNINDVVNRQAEVLVLLVSPMVVAFVFSVPVVLPLLFSSKFLPVLSMIQVAAMSIFFRALYLPVEYMTLANGHSVSFCILEGVNGLCMVVSVLVGYNAGALFGAGVGIALSSAIEVAVSYTFVHFKYGYCVSAQLLRLVAVLLPLVLLSMLLPCIDGMSAYCALGIALLVASGTFSLVVLDRKVRLVSVVKDKLAFGKRKRTGGHGV